MNTSTPYGFRVLGSPEADRKLVSFAPAFAAYCRNDAKATPDSEAYLSLFEYDARFAEHLRASLSVRGLPPCSLGGGWLWFDIDREGELGAALSDAQVLTVCLIDDFALPEDSILAFFSGSKGFHIGLPTAAWEPESGEHYHLVCKEMAMAVAGVAGIDIDTSVYDRVRIFRAPNTPHPKTGLRKRRLTCAELMNTHVDSILALARDPLPFEPPVYGAGCNEKLQTLWHSAEERVRLNRQAAQAHRGTGTFPKALNRQTLEFIREGAQKGERQTRLYSAAANLFEFGAPKELAAALLTEAAEDCGLPPKDIARTIGSAFAKGGHHV